MWAMWRKRISFALLVGRQPGAATLENSMKVPQKTKNRTTLQPSNYTSRYLSKGYKMLIQRGTCSSMFIAALSTIAKVWKSPNVHRLMDKEEVVHIYNRILLSDQKEWNLAICNNVDGTGECYAKWNKSYRERKISYVFTFMWILRNLTEDHGRGEGKKKWEGGRLRLLKNWE